MKKNMKIKKLRKLVEVLKEQNKDLEKRYNMKCFEVALFVSQVSGKPIDFKPFENKELF